VTSFCPNRSMVEYGHALFMAPERSRQVVLAEGIPARITQLVSECASGSLPTPKLSGPKPTQEDL
jgi:hypothetical protein